MSTDGASAASSGGRPGPGPCSTEWAGAQPREAPTAAAETACSHAANDGWTYGLALIISHTSDEGRYRRPHKAQASQASSAKLTPNALRRMGRGTLPGL